MRRVLVDTRWWIAQARSFAYNGVMDNKGRTLILMSVAVVLAFGVGFLAGGQGFTQAGTHGNGIVGAPSGVDLEPVWRAWELLDEKFVPATTTSRKSDQDKVWGLISGLALSYEDPYTTFLPPQQSKSFEQDIQGSFGGVGFEMGMRDGILSIIAPLKGTPAEAAGLRPGDLILEVDGMPTNTMSIDDAVEHIRGEIGTEVVLTIAREGEQELLTVPIIRDTIEIPTLDTELRDDGIYVISLYNFGGTAVREMRSALRDVLETESTDIIIDLRGNPGGFLEAAVEVASYFLPVGTPVVVEDYGEDLGTYIHRSKGYDIADEDWTIVVLIDGGSASASEIVAGALQEHERAILIGEQTYGKGSVQELVDLTEETSLKITVARWLTPNGRSLSETGLAPDLTVPLSTDDFAAGLDPQFDAAVTYLTTGELVAPMEESTEENGILEEADEIE
jgi:carboxyl-terminal processing protease